MPVTHRDQSLRRALARVGLILLCAGLAACSRPEGGGLLALGDARGYAPPPAIVGGATYYFTPFEGIPGNIGDVVLRSLQRRAREQGIDVVRRADRPADFRVVGTLTAVSGDTTSIVFYDFDIIDTATGRLMHRISGQRTSDPSRGDPWARIAGTDLRDMTEVVAARLGAWIRAART